MLGSMVATLANGSQAAARVQKGLMHWCDHISKEMKRWIMRQSYGNHPDSVEKLRKSDKQKDKDFAATHFPGDDGQLDPEQFSARAFLVCIAWTWYGKVVSCTSHFQVLVTLYPRYISHSFRHSIIHQLQFCAECTGHVTLPNIYSMT